MGQLPLVPPDQSTDWVLNASIDYLGSLPPYTSLRYHLTDGNRKIIVRGELTNVTSTEGTITGSAIIPKGSVELWWPIDMGTQPLYNLTVEVVSQDNKTTLSVQKRIGFRTIVVNMWPVTEERLNQGIAPGNHWHFEINGHEFFAKGSSKYDCESIRNDTNLGRFYPA